MEVGDITNDGTLVVENTGSMQNDVNIGAGYWCSGAGGCFNGESTVHRSSVNVIMDNFQTRYGAGPNTTYANKQMFESFVFERVTPESDFIKRGSVDSPFLMPDLFPLAPSASDTAYLQVEVVLRGGGSTFTENRFTGDISQAIILESECS